jgi:TonB family protein
MMESVVEAALRTLVVAGVLRLGIAAFRVTDAQREKVIWTTLLLGGLAMPALLQWAFIPPLKLLPAAAPAVVRQTLGHSGLSLSGRVALFLLYAGVSSALLVRMAVGVGRMWRIRRDSTPIREPWSQGLDVRMAHELSSPATFGATILLPRSYPSWSESKRTLVLQHEATHVQHCDSQVQWLAGLHACVLWFSPLPWWLRRKLAELAEYTSDDAVLRLNIPRADYAAVLLEEAAGCPPRPMWVGMAGRGLEQRVDRILAAKSPGEPLSRGRGALAALSAVAMLAVASASTGQQPRPERGWGVPSIISGPSLDEMMSYYPVAAKQRKVEGLVQITVTLDRAGRATKTRILSERPAGLGFGQAATDLARQFKYANPAARPRALTYRVKFELAKRLRQP